MENLDAYGDASIGGQAGGRQPTGPDGSWLEPLMVLDGDRGHDQPHQAGHIDPAGGIATSGWSWLKQLATLDVLSDRSSGLGGWSRLAA